MAMAAVTIGGMLLSAVFTLFVIPVVYVALDRFARPPAAEDCSSYPQRFTESLRPC